MEIEIYFIRYSCLFYCVRAYKSFNKVPNKICKGVAVKKFLFTALFLFLFFILGVFSVFADPGTFSNGVLFKGSYVGSYDSSAQGYLEVTWIPPGVFPVAARSDFKFHWDIATCPCSEWNACNSACGVWSVRNYFTYSNGVYYFRVPVNCEISGYYVIWRITIESPSEWAGNSGEIPVSYQSSFCNAGSYSSGVGSVSSGSVFRMNSIRMKGVGGYEIRY